VLREGPDILFYPYKNRMLRTHLYYYTHMSLTMNDDQKPSTSGIAKVKKESRKCLPFSKPSPCNPFSVELEKDIFLIVREWLGEAIVELRLFENGLPSRKGLDFPPQRWNSLMCSTDEINKALQGVIKGESNISYESHIGGNVFVQVTSPYRVVDIRQRYFKDGRLYYTKVGIKLHPQGWQKVLDTRCTVIDCIPNLDDHLPCFMREDHQNQEGALTCPECSPNSYAMF